MATINVTARHLNDQKRTAEAVVVTVPAIAQERGGRTLQPPLYYQYGDVLQATVLPAGTIIQKVYLVVDEAFPASSTATVSVNGTAFFTDADITAKGLTASTTEDLLVEAPQNLEVTIGGGSGDITFGKLRVVLEILSTNLKNGNYAEGVA
jgi:hypothetical protein